MHNCSHCIRLAVYNMEEFRTALDTLCETLGSLEEPYHQRAVEDVHTRMPRNQRQRVAPRLCDSGLSKQWASPPRVACRGLVH